jgi:hypothetical protein
VVDMAEFMAVVAADFTAAVTVTAVTSTAVAGGAAMAWARAGKRRRPDGYGSAIN